MAFSLSVDLDVPDGDGDAELDFFVFVTGNLAGARVADAPGGLELGAGEADAHPAAVFRREPGVFGLLQQRLPRVGALAPAAPEADLAFGVLRVEGQRGRRELFGVHTFTQLLAHG